MPNQGVVSMFNFGRSCGAVHGVLAALSIPYMMTRPEVWKSALGLGRDKQESLKLAKSLWPEHAHLWALRKNDGIAEAALLAHYCIKATRNEGDDFGELI
jgi:crossover junction endodeoxyribonuclease RuvC